MAKMEIYQSQATAKSPAVPQVGPTLSQPFELATHLGSSITKLGKTIETIYDKRKETQDANEARNIFREIEPVIVEQFNNTSLSSDINQVKTFYQNTSFNKFSGILKNRKANKRVNELLDGEIFKTQTGFATKLYATITKNHYNETKQGHDEDLNKIIFKMAANDSITRAMAYKEFNSFFNSIDRQHNTFFSA